MVSGSNEVLVQDGRGINATRARDFGARDFGAPVILADEGRFSETTTAAGMKSCLCA